MKIPLLRHDRNETPQLWSRLEASTSVPLAIYTVMLMSCLLLRQEDPLFRTLGFCVLILAFCLAVAHSVNLKRILSELKKRQGKEPFVADTSRGYHSVTNTRGE